MLTLESKLENKVFDYIHAKNELERLGFTLGGNWDYDRGMFDRPLDDGQTVWLRIPFAMMQGELDSEVRDTEARIRMGAPFVLKHLRREGEDEAARARVSGALIDQFRKPVEQDGEIEPQWADRAQSVLREAESLLV